MILWLISFGLISGITTWLFGFGGGFVTVPLLYTLILTLWAGDSLYANCCGYLCAHYVVFRYYYDPKTP